MPNEIIAIYPGSMGNIPITREMWGDAQPFAEATKRHIDDWFAKHIHREKIIDVPITIVEMEAEHA